MDDVIKTSYDIKNIKDVKELLNGLGISAEEESSTVGATVVTHNFFLTDPRDFLKIQRVVKPLGAFLMTDCRQVQSETAHFAIELDRKDRQTIPYSSQSESFETNKLVLGVNQNNEPVKVALKDLPHMLIAGASGSGKSVCIHSLVRQMIDTYKNGGARLVLIDTKRVEFERYTKVDNLYTDVINKENIAVRALKIICDKLDERYDEMQKKHQRECTSFPIVIVIDELADLMLRSGWLVEKNIVKIAQLGRACNIHLILATQRPQAKVCTGLILANVPTRIALQTATWRESTMILGHKGAEKLKGKGDALLKLATSTEEQRIQCMSLD